MTGEREKKKRKKQEDFAYFKTLPLMYKTQNDALKTPVNLTKHTPNTNLTINTNKKTRYQTNQDETNRPLQKQR